MISAISIPSSAETNFFFNLYGGSTNFWSSQFLQVPTIVINGLISSALGNVVAFDEADEYALRYDLFRVKNDGERIKIDNGDYFGFKSKDMFSNVQYGIKAGWQPELSPFGIYISCGYQFNKFRAQFDPNILQWEKLKIHSLRPGLGIRVTPFINMLEDKEWSPILEVGTSYNYTLGCSDPFENNKDQFKNGMLSTYGVGARFMENISITAGVELYHYSIFNQEFSPDNGITYPYKDIKSKKLTIFVSVSHDF